MGHWSRPLGPGVDALAGRVYGSSHLQDHQKGFSVTESAVAIPEDDSSGPIAVSREEMLSLGFDPDLEFRKLLLEATHVAAGFRLITDKHDLIGIPFIIIGLTYREGIPREGRVADYISCEAVAADPVTMAALVPEARRREMTIFPNEPIVFNDSSTGIRRQLTAYLHQAEIIDVGKPGKPEKKPDGTEFIPNRFDRSYQFWARGEDLATTGITQELDERPLRYVCPRGLRVSEYAFGSKTAETFYIG